MNIMKILDDDLFIDFVNAARRTLDRVVVYCVFGVVLLVQMKVAGRVLSDAEIATLSDFVSVFGETYSVYMATSVLLIAWVLVPLMSFILRLAVIYLRDRRGIMEATSS